MNIAFVTSSGGHSGQIKLIFTNEIIGKNNAIFVTETVNLDRTMKENSFNQKFRTYFFKKDNLQFNPFKYFFTMIDLIKIFKKEKIDLIITNGAQISIPAVIGARLIGVETIFMDTVIRVKTPNWSAKACYLFCDKFIVQHEEMMKKYGKKSEYHGGVI